MDIQMRLSQNGKKVHDKMALKELYKSLANEGGIIEIAINGRGALMKVKSIHMIYGNDLVNVELENEQEKPSEEG